MLDHYVARVYRNFATSIESQELMDDLTPDPEHREILKKFYYPEKCPPSKPVGAVERVLGKSMREIIQEEIDSKFDPSHWYASRYSDGTWAVLYAAESEETALREVLYHLHRHFYREELRKTDIPVQRRVVSLRVCSERCRDLTNGERPDRRLLLSQDESGYPYCQSLAKESIREGAQLLRALSARHPGGVCTPIFDKNVVAKDEGHLKYLKCVLKRDGTTEVTGVIEEATKVYQSP